MNQVAVVGLGLIGGSLALALRRRGIAVCASDADSTAVAQARRSGLAVFDGARALVSGPTPDAIVICAPISAIASVYREYHRELAGLPTLFFHAGGLQSPEHLGLRSNEAAGLTGTHPLAGTHASGFPAAREDLFDNCTVVIDSGADQRRINAAVELWTAAGAGRFVVEDARMHDARMAAVSHLPQLASTALAVTIRERGYDAHDVGTGGRDATRLAASPPRMWLEILQRCPDEAVTLLSRLQWNVGRIREAIASGDWSEVERIWDEGRALHDTDARDNADA